MSQTNIRRVLKVGFVLLLICVRPFFSLAAIYTLQSGSEDSLYIKHFYLDTGITEFMLPEEDLLGKRIFVSGENHYYDKLNSKVELSLLKYLHKNAKVRHLLLELGSARGYVVNEYINGDSSYKELLSSETGYTYTKFFDRLKKYNMSLPENERITVHGVDIERFPNEPLLLLSKIIPDSLYNLPDDIGLSLESIRLYANYLKNYKSRYKYYDYDYEDEDEEDEKKSAKNSFVPIEYFRQSGYYQIKYLDTLIREYGEKKERFKSSLGENFPLFDQLMGILKEARNYQNYSFMPQQEIMRERKIKNTIASLLKEHPDENFFGQFGRCHINQEEANTDDCNWNGNYSMTLRLIQDGYQDKLLSIALLYYNPRLSYGTTDNSKSVYSYQTKDEDILNFIGKYMDYLKDSDSSLLIKLGAQDSSLQKMHQYAMIISTTMNTSTSYTEYTSSYYPMEWSTSFDFLYGNSTLNLNNLNTALVPNGVKPFKAPLTHYLFGISVADFGFHFSANYMHLPTQSYKDSFNTLRLSGYKAYITLGGSINAAKHLMISPHIIYSYSRLRLNISSDSSKLNPPYGFAENTDRNYVNGAFCLGAGVDLRWQILGPLALLLKANYMYDISSKNWKSGSGLVNKRTSVSPSTSLSGFNISAGISLMGIN